MFSRLPAPPSSRALRFKLVEELREPLIIALEDFVEDYLVHEHISHHPGQDAHSAVIIVHYIR